MPLHGSIGRLAVRQRTHGSQPRVRPRSEAVSPALPARRTATKYGVPMNRPLEGRIILIAEDEPLIALQMTLALEDEGAFVIRARTLKEAIIGVEDHTLSAAILDHALNDADTSTVCERMSERNIPFVIYSDCERSNGAVLGGIHVEKTGLMPELVAAVKRVIADRLTCGPRQVAGLSRAPAASTLRRTLHLS